MFKFKLNSKQQMDWVKPKITFIQLPNHHQPTAVTITQSHLATLVHTTPAGRIK